MEQPNSNSNIDWGFPVAEYAGIFGLNIPGIEEFKDHLMESLAREICQNSLDARKDKEKPVVIEFSDFTISPNEFPKSKTFNEMLELQIKYWKANMKWDTETVKYFVNAQNIFSKELFCLRISDFNTIGLSGSNDEEDGVTPWQNLVKGVGVSDKHPTDGGSKGIGKFASFACSKIYTVFYSTWDTNGYKASQGVARLASFKNKDEKLTLGNGFYGETKKYSSIPRLLPLDKGYSRAESGTDIYIIGFANDDELWQDQIIASVIDSFMISIAKGDLIFKMKGKPDLNKVSLNTYIEQYKDENFLNEFTKEYYDVLTESKKTSKFYYSMFEKDDIELSLIISPEMRNRVAIIRSNGMKIQDKGNLPRIANYSGILLLKGDEVNGYFRKLENPKHNGWLADRSNNKKDAERRIKMLRDFIVDSINSLLENNKQKSVDAEGIGEILPDEIEDDSSKQNEKEDITNVIEKIEVKPLKPKRPFTRKTENGGGQEPWPGPGPGPRPGPSPRPGPGPNPHTNVDVYIEAKNSRLFVDNNENYHLKFSVPNDTKNLRVELEISGETSNEKVELLPEIKTNGINSNAAILGNSILLKEIKANQQVELIFRLKQRGDWALEANYYENK